MLKEGKTDLDKFKEMDIGKQIIYYLKDLINIVENKILLNEKDLNDCYV